MGLGPKTEWEKPNSPKAKRASEPNSKADNGSTFSFSPLSSVSHSLPHTHHSLKLRSNNFNSLHKLQREKKKKKKMLACPSSSLHGLATLQRHSQPSHFLLSKPLFFPRLAASHKCNFRSLLSGNNRRRSAVRASADSPEVPESVGVGDGGGLQPYSVKIPVGDRHVSLNAWISFFFFCFFVGLEHFGFALCKCCWRCNLNVFGRLVFYYFFLLEGWFIIVWSWFLYHFF